MRLKRGALFCDPYLQTLYSLKYAHEIKAEANPSPKPVFGAIGHSDHLFNTDKMFRLM